MFASTMLVHAPAKPGAKIDEDHPIDPAWAYPRSKIRAEAAVSAEHGELRTVVLRPAGIYDDDGSAAFLCQQIARIYERLPTAYLYAGDLDRGQPYLHVDDFVDAVVRVIERCDDLPDGTAILLGEETTPTYRQMQTTLGRLIHGDDWQTFSLPKPLAQAGTWFQTDVLEQDSYIRPRMVSMSEDHYELDIGRAERLLDWRPGHDLMATLPEIVRRLKADRPGWHQRNGLDPATVAGAEPVIAASVEATASRSDEWLQQASAATEATRRQKNWCHLVNMVLALWLIASPFLHGLFDQLGPTPPPPALGHEVASATMRNTWLGWSEIVSGIVILLLSGLSFRRRRGLAPWITTVVGCWLLLAPLVFWTTSPAA